MKKGNGNKPVLTGLGYMMRNFSKKHRVSIRDGADEQVWYMYISPLRIFLAILGSLLVMFALVVTLVVYTPVLDALPGYPGRKAREMLRENVLRIDSLERRMLVMQEYGDNVAQVLSGSVPDFGSLGAADSAALHGEMTAPSAADSLLREQMRGDGRFALQDGVVVSSGNTTRRKEFFAPVRGEVVSRFDPSSGFYGVGILPSGAQEVVASQAGTVVTSQWSPQDGYMLIIQHEDDYLTFYKHNAQLFKMTGDRVESGEVIGYIEPGVVDNATRGSGELVFELWADGVPLDPQRFVMFQ